MTRALITGAAGHVGKAVLAQEALGAFDVLACDVVPIKDLPKNASFQKMDVRGSDVDKVIGSFKPEVVIHLASIVSPPKGTGNDFAYDVDVNGSRNVIDACVRHKVRRLVVTSSGAAYGYHEDNPVPLKEADLLRGNDQFPYARHKRLVEEMLAETREEHPDLEQVIFRVGTVLGDGMENQITALFHRKRLLGVKGSESPFVFIWDQDLARILLRAAGEGPPGIFNVAGDGTLGTSDFSRILGKPVLWLPAWSLKLALGIAKPLGISQYGPEQVRFLQYRPVLDNNLLKTEFGYTPERTSGEVFEAWRKQAGL